MPSLMPHQRINESLTRYWRDLAGSRPFPPESEVEPEALGAIWNWCFLLSVAHRKDGVPDYCYTYLGPELIAAYGENVTESAVSLRLINPASPPLVEKFDDVLRLGAPVMDDNQFTNPQGMLIKYRSSLLPLGGARNEVKFILGGMKWRAY